MQKIHLFSKRGKKQWRQKNHKLPAQQFSHGGGLKRKQIFRKRKNFFPTFLAIALSWLACIAVVYFIDPSARGAVLLLILLVFIAGLFTFSTLWANARRGIVTSAAIAVFLSLRYFGVGNWLNFVLLSATCFTFEMYFSRKA